MSLQGIRNVPPNGVFGNEVYGGDSEGFGMNPSSNEFRLCNSDEWRSRNHGGRVIIRGYGSGGDMVVHHGLKGCVLWRIFQQLAFFKVVESLYSLRKWSPECVSGVSYGPTYDPNSEQVSEEFSLSFLSLTAFTYVGVSSVFFPRTRPRERKSTNIGGEFTKSRGHEVLKS
ncbi:hypothetical protein Tco_0112029 [Tanacetum coccineum]